MDAVGNRLVLVDEYLGVLVEESMKSDFVRDVSESCGFDPDSVLFLSKQKDIMMRIFDRDGTEETMCGNGLRCVARYAFDNGYISEKASINTLDGIKHVQILDELIRTNFGEVKKYEEINPNLHFAYSGLPHLVVFMDDLDTIDAEIIARGYRYNTDITQPLGYPDNMHVNLVQVLNRNIIKIKSYEACVERITQACGTGAVASAYVVNKLDKCDFPIKIINPGGVLIADKDNGDFILTGPAKIVDQVEYNLGSLQIIRDVRDLCLKG